MVTKNGTFGHQSMFHEGQRNTAAGTSTSGVSHHETATLAAESRGTPRASGSVSSGTETHHRSLVYTIDLTVGKKGGTFHLPFGGQLTVPPDALVKQSVITCSRVPEHERYLHEPTLSKEENLASELYVVDLHGRSLKRTIDLQMVYYPVNRDVTDVGVTWKPSDSTTWESIESKPGPDEVISISATNGGVFVVISYPRKDHFELPVLGCLYSTKLHRMVTVRCPRGAATANMQCDMQIIPLRSESLMSPLAKADIIASTDFFQFKTSPEDVQFKRPVTVKLPLPGAMESDDTANQGAVAVCQTASSKDIVTSWIVHDGPLKLAKKSVTFDTKLLTKFVVILVKPSGAMARTMLPNEKRLPDTLTRIDTDNNRPVATILPFFHLAPKRWTLWVDCVRKDMTDDAIQARSGMTLLKSSSQQLATTITVPVGNSIQRSSAGRTLEPVAKFASETTHESDVRAANGTVFAVEVSGDVEISEEDGGKDNAKVTCHQGLSINSRRFTIIPKPASVADGPKILKGIIRVLVTESGAGGDQHQQRGRSFAINIPLSVVTDYLYVEPTPEIEKNDAKPDAASAQNKPVVAETPPPVVRRNPKEITQIVNRLTKSARMVTTASREPRVLSGRSLQCLAREIPAGINLGIRLNLSESTITGMSPGDPLRGFRPAADFTYRILLQWKRQSAAHAGGRTADNGLTQVTQLVDAIVGVGQPRIAAIVFDRHRANMELTPACFLQTPTAESVSSITGEPANADL